MEVEKCQKINKILRFVDIIHGLLFAIDIALSEGKLGRAHDLFRKCS